MAIRNDNLGGSDWADGDIAFAVDFNDTFDAVLIHRKQFSDATTRTKTGDTSFADSGTAFTFSAPVGSLMIGFYFTLRIKTSGGGATASAGLTITGSNLGTSFVVSKGQTSTGESTGYETTETDIFNTAAATLNLKISSYFTPLKILDASTTFTIRIKTSDGAQTTTIDNVTLDIIYLNNFAED